MGLVRSWQGIRRWLGFVPDSQAKLQRRARRRLLRIDPLETRHLLTLTIQDASFLTSGTVAAGATSLTVTFSEPVVGANLGTNYQLQRAGSDGLLGTVDDPLTTISSATVAGNTTTLNFAALSEDVYRLTVKDTITDAAGTALDGDGNGTAGGDWRKDFVVGALSTSLTSPNGFVFDSEFGGFGAGQLVQGTGNAFDGMGRLNVDGGAYYLPSINTVSPVSYEVNGTSQRASTLGDSASLLTTTTKVMPGLTQSLTLMEAKQVRLSAVVPLVNQESVDLPVELAFRVDGSVVEFRSYLLRSRAINMAQVNAVALEDYISLPAGSHTIEVVGRNPFGGSASVKYSGAFDATDWTPAVAPPASTLKVVEFENLPTGGSSVTITEVNGTSQRASTLGDSASLLTTTTKVMPGLTQSLTLMEAKQVRLSAVVPLVNQESVDLPVELAFRVDGSVVEFRSYLLRSRAINMAQVNAVALEDYISLPAGSHTIEVVGRNPFGGSASVKYSGAFDATDWTPAVAPPASTLKVVEFENLPTGGSSVTITEVNGTSQRASTLGDSASLLTTTTKVMPGLTQSLTLMEAKQVRLSAVVPLVNQESVDLPVELAFRVDGSVVEFRSYLLRSRAINMAQVNAVALEDYISLPAGSHTIEVVGRNPFGGSASVKYSGAFDATDWTPAVAPPTSALRIAEFSSIPHPITSDGGTTVSQSVHAMFGVAVSREVTVPATGSHNFSRTVDTFTNSTGGTITAPVRIVGNLGSDASTTVFATSDGDTLVEPTDWWFGTDDADGTGTPAIIHLIHGPLGQTPTDVQVIGDNVEWTYSLTVDAGQTKRLAYFTVLGTTRADAIASANALVTPTGFGGQAAAFLTAGELDSLTNFQFAPYIVDSSFLSSGTVAASATTLTVTFSEPMLNASVAANYELRRAGTDGLLLAGDAVLNPSSVSLSGNVATLTFAALVEDVYRLTVKDTITDAAGTALDGDGNGTAGGDWRKDFVVGALSTSLTSPNGFVFDPEFGGFGAGQLVQGTGNAFDGLGKLKVAGSDFSIAASIPAEFEAKVGTGSGSTLSSGFADVSGLAASINVGATGNVVRVSGAINNIQLPTIFAPHGFSETIEARLVVDGVATGVLSTFRTSTIEFVAGTGLIAPDPFQSPGASYYIYQLGGGQIDFEEYLTLGAGTHSIQVQIRARAGATWQNASLNVMEFSVNAQAVDLEAKVGTGSGSTLSSGFADVSGLAASINVGATGNVVRVSGAINNIQLPTIFAPTDFPRQSKPGW